MKLQHPDLLFIDGVEQLVAIYGEGLCFHDSEVHRITLTRADPQSGDVSCLAEIQLFRVQRNEPTGELSFSTFNLVALEFQNVQDLTLQDFNHQNVLTDLHIRKVEAPQDGEVYAVSLSPAYGLGADFTCSRIRVASISPSSAGIGQTVPSPHETSP